MQSNRFKFYFICFGVWFFLFVLNIASGYADEFKAADSKDRPGDPAVSDFSESDDFEAFDEFSEFGDTQSADIHDPLSGYNRFMTGFNDHFYVLLFRPVAKGYRFIVIKPVRQAIDRAFTNAAYPVRFINNLLQLKVKRAGVETARFCVNTTMGVAGLFDPAQKCMGLEAYPEDFGQTLGHYGAGNGFPIVLPFAGPSNLRDLLGYAPDMYMNPITYVRDVKVAFAVGVIVHFNALSLYLDEYDAMRAEAIDLYIFQRDVYEMRRKKMIEE